MGTPNVDRYVAAVRRRFSWATSIGEFSCRPIAGTRTWSQHAYDAGNAADVMSGRLYEDTAQSRARNEAVWRWLSETVLTTGGYMKRWQAYGIRTVLLNRRSAITGGRVAGHTDHTHADFWPQGYGTPPCKGGRLQVVYPNGATGSRFILYPSVSIIPTPSQEDPHMFLPIDKNNLPRAKSDVAFAASMLNVAFGLNLPVDGTYPVAMENAVKTHLGWDDRGSLIHGKRYARLLAAYIRKIA